MKLIVASCVALAFTTIAASADTWSGAYGNTIVSTYDNGNVVKVYVEPNHSYTIKLPNGQMLSGTWADGGGQSCFTVTAPPPKPGATPTCFALKDYKIGDSFSGQDSNGSFHGVINPGR